jgi:hypothetical protein
MKKLSVLLIMVLLTAIPSLVNAQGKTRIGAIRAGYQSATQLYDGAKIEETKPLGNFYVGFYRDNRIIPTLSFSTGIEYFTNGYQIKSLDTKYEIGTLAIPLALKLKVGPIFALAGSGVNFKLSEKYKVDGKEVDLPGESDTKFYDVPVFVGGGFKILIFSIEARYDWGMIDVNEKTRNRYLQVGASVAF